ncbi:MAG: hypothetical protein AAGI17_09380 [Planctomycetota bacterium]
MRSLCHVAFQSVRRVRESGWYGVQIRGSMLAVLASLGGCFSTPEGFDSPDPNRRLDAIVDAAREPGSTESIPMLIEQLESLDPAARLFAIRTLEKKTGETFGYDHAANAWERSGAVRRWADWAEENGYRSDPNERSADALPEAGI